MENKLESAGLSANLGHHVEVAERPWSLQWITDELLTETRRVWAVAYQREIGDDEAAEILINVKRFAELLQSISQKG